MDASTISALSGAPASLIALYLVITVMRDRRKDVAIFTKARALDRQVIQRLAVNIQRQSALLLLLLEEKAPGRAQQLQRVVSNLFPNVDDADPNLEVAGEEEG